MSKKFDDFLSLLHDIKHGTELNPYAHFPAASQVPIAVAATGNAHVDHINVQKRAQGGDTSDILSSPLSLNTESSGYNDSSLDNQKKRHARGPTRNTCVSSEPSTPSSTSSSSSSASQLPLTQPQLSTLSLRSNSVTNKTPRTLKEILNSMFRANYFSISNRNLTTFTMPQEKKPDNACLKKALEFLQSNITQEERGLLSEKISVEDCSNMFELLDTQANNSLLKEEIPRLDVRKEQTQDKLQRFCHHYFQTGSGK